MPQSLFTMISDVLLFVETAAHSAEASKALKGAGYGDAEHRAGEELIELSMESALDVSAEVGSDTTLIHLIHVAATEVEMWHRALASKVGEGLGESRAFVLGEDIHAEDHTLSVLARTRRTLGMLKVHVGLREALGSTRRVEDQYQRGSVLSARLAKLADQQTDLEDKRVDRPVLPSVVAKLEQWLASSHAMATAAFAEAPELFGAIGYVPTDVSSDCGGASKNAVRHQRAIRQAPGPEHTRAPGWGAGRQNRNKENVGQGY